MSTLYAAKTTSWTVLRDLLRGLKSWHNNSRSFRGYVPEYVGLYEDTGKLSEWLRSQFRADAQRDGIQYVIYSYATPIAWLSAGTWTTPDVSYSPTTRAHQSKAFTAISMIDA